MTLQYLMHGVAIGFCIAAPVGPIGLLCIRRSLAEGWLVGLATGLGAATADAAYGCIAGFGLTAAYEFLVGQRPALQALGGMFLCFLGTRIALSRPAAGDLPPAGNSLLGAYASTLALTLTNPMTILSFAAVFTNVGLGRARDYWGASALVGGVFAGSALWWVLLSSSVARLRTRLNTRWMEMVNRLSGCAIAGFGLYALLASARL